MRALVIAFALSQSSPEDVAKLQHDVSQATAAVDKKYEGRALTPEERKQQVKERAAAEREVLDKAGVSAKDFARASAKQSKADREATQAAADRLSKQDSAAKQKADGAPGEVVIEKGGQGELTPEEEAKAMDQAAGFGKAGSPGKAAKRRK
jgi:hypothetical protein